MYVEQLGDGRPEIAIIAGIHGDEPCGVEAVKDFLNTNPQVDKPVKFIIANEVALEEQDRYIDADLNRLFAENVSLKPDSLHEHNLAERIKEEVKDYKYIISFHSTQSSEEPFALYNSLTANIKTVLKNLSLTKAISTPASSLTELENVIDIECGHQNTLTAEENAKYLLTEFLRVTKVINSPETHTIETDVMLYQMDGVIDKENKTAYDVFVENFSLTQNGEPIAKHPNGNVIKAQEPFYPYLVSSEGYETQLGYKANQIGWLSTYTPTE